MKIFEQYESATYPKELHVHDYRTIKIMGIKNAFGAGQHYAVSVERCRVCYELRMTSYETEEWYEVKDEIPTKVE